MTPPDEDTTTDVESPELSWVKVTPPMFPEVLSWSVNVPEFVADTKLVVGGSWVIAPAVTVSV